MNKESQRLNIEWYLRRIKNTSAIRKHLIKLINKHKRKSFELTDSQLRELRVEDLAELTIAVANKNLAITLGSGSDLNDYSEVKLVTSQARNNIKFNKRTGKSDWLNSYTVQGTKNKKGALRVIAYNTILKEFEYFFIPADDYDNNKSKLEIVIERYSTVPGSEPPFKGYNDDTYSKWYLYKCKSFEEMALAQ